MWWGIQGPAAGITEPGATGFLSETGAHADGQRCLHGPAEARHAGGWAARLLFYFFFRCGFINPLPRRCATSAPVLSTVNNVIMDIPILLFWAILTTNFFSREKLGVVFSFLYRHVAPGAWCVLGGAESTVP